MNWHAYTGIAVRYMVKTYVHAIAFVMFALLIVALSIDLSGSLDSIRNRAAAKNTTFLQLLTVYIGYRSVDIVVRLLSMACLIGAGAATILRRQRLEDVILASSGASPRITLTALAIVGVVTGATQAGLQNWLRPPAVQAQVELQLGRYGRWFARTDLDHQWFVADGRAVRARVTRGETAKLSEIVLFEGIDQDALKRIVWAESAYQLSPGTWQLVGSKEWTQEGEGALVPILDVELELPINHTAIRWFGVHGYYIPNSALRQIAQLEGTDAANDAATALAFRTMAFFLPGVFALLGATLATAGLGVRRMNPFRLLVFAAVGYVLLVSVKVFWALGIHGRLSPYVAATVPMGLALSVSLALQVYLAGYFRLKR